MSFYKRISLGWYFTLLLFIGLYVLPLVYRGLFLDGLHYAIISQNIANNIGDIWHLYAKGLQPFHGHPPLLFFLESFFFKIFGNVFWAESLFMLGVSIATLFLIYKLWVLLGKWKNSEQMTGKNAWIPILLWEISVGIGWSYTNNILDPLVCLFSLIALYYILKHCHFTPPPLISINIFSYSSVVFLSA